MDSGDGGRESLSSIYGNIATLFCPKQDTYVIQIPYNYKSLQPYINMAIHASPLFHQYYITPFHYHYLSNIYLDIFHFKQSKRLLSELVFIYIIFIDRDNYTIHLLAYLPTPHLPNSHHKMYFKLILYL